MLTWKSLLSYFNSLSSWRQTFHNAISLDVNLKSRSCRTNRICREGGGASGCSWEGGQLMWCTCTYRWGLAGFIRWTTWICCTHTYVRREAPSAAAAAHWSDASTNAAALLVRRRHASKCMESLWRAQLTINSLSFQQTWFARNARYVFVAQETLFTLICNSKILQNKFSISCCSGNAAVHKSA